MSEDQNSVVTLKVRVSPEFREKIVNTAKANNRSMNQEIVARLEKSFENNIPSTLVSEYMQAVEEKNDMIKKQLEISNLLVLKLAEKLPDDDPSKSRMLELINQLN
ncbi:Arc family DNA-binding protein [Acinetobacter defluvii]|uniref:Arc family DNA-binding protein n=1 Tax=Acinetobacter defluvii TaxID=1871111 RepID=A0A2S2FED1_9GAMM|nr:MULTISPECIES: Arc family DNA-binding protein [Acinetobacter]AWL29331.1 Arc family DNA-binding protein [Acinetobacter defluvii]RKG43835.1 Arc family DNA-binding protein [Acinetobacter cumulans]RKG50806.1 Arc family DNA-binding protein [Acinetobacter cumulans]RZG59550.1 Arc family DNA-binding protein [Acinetobacter sp. WCHAc060006]